MTTRLEGFSMRLLGMVLAAAASMLFAPLAARAATCTVNATTSTGSGSGSSGDILYCVTQANAAPANSTFTINFDSSLYGQTITLGAALTLANNNSGVTLSIQGPGANLLTISGGNAVQVFSIQSGKVGISGLTIANGYSSAGGGAILVSAGLLTVNNSTFSGNTSANCGGGIYNQFTATVGNSTFSGNTSQFGGGICNAGVLTLTNSTLSGNTANVGGGIYNRAGSTLTLTNNIVADNTTTGEAGDDCDGCGSPSDPNLISTPGRIIDPGLAPLGWYGGPTQTMIPLPGSAAIGAGQVTASDFPINDQRGFFRDAKEFAATDLGAVQTNYLIVTTTDDTADSSPGCNNSGGSPCSLRDAITVANLVAFNSTRYSSGTDISFASGVTGAINLNPSNGPLGTITGLLDLVGPGVNNLTVSGGSWPAVDTIFTVNSPTANVAISGLTIASGYGSTSCAGDDNSSAGGICINSGTLALSNSAVSGNTGTLGGGLSNYAGVLTVSTSTLSGNNGQIFGGGIYSQATTMVSNSTLSGNASGSSGGAVYIDAGTLTATSSTFSGNSGETGGGILNYSGGIVKLSNSIVAGNTSFLQPGNDCYNCGTQSASNLISNNPLLAPLGNYGGPMQTMLPLPGSPAICLASPALASGLSTDQRGFPRLNTSYTGYDSGTPCVDAGAVQTNYQSVQFTNAGAGGYSGKPGVAVDTPAAPIVSVTENGQNIGGVPVTLSVSGAGTASGAGPVTTVAGAGAEFDALTLSAGGNDTLSATLDITSSNSVSITTSAALDIALVNQATLTVTGPTSVTYGTTGNATATGGSGTGALSFSAGGSTGCSVSGASVSVTNASGTCSITATMAGDDNYNPTTSASFTVSLVKANQATLTVTGPTSVANGTTGTATATGGSGTGALSFSAGGSTGCSVSGATVSVTNASGACSLTATKAADNNYNAATSAPFNVTLVSANTNTTITSHTPNPSVVGQAVTVSFAVSPVPPATGTPTGNVTVSDGVGDTCVAAVAAGKCNLTIMSAGSVTLTAIYAGGNYNGSTSPGVSQYVSKAYTRTTITAHSPNPSVTGQPVTVSFTVTTVAPGGGTPSGNVLLTDLLGDSCTATVAAGSCSIAFAFPGPKLLVASYLGNSNYDLSVTAQIPQNVADFAISVSPAKQTVSPGGKTTYTVSLTPVNGLAGPVSLACGGAPANSTCAISPGSLTLSGSASKTTTATITTSKNTPPGSYTLTLTGTYGSGSPSTGGLTHNANVTLTVH